jgi:membrane-associated phospholipid phosphatase
VAGQFVQIHFDNAVAFVRARLSPAGLYGLYFTVGTIALVGALWMFGGISEDLINSDPLIQVDALISEWFRTHADARVEAGMAFASALASTATVGVLFALVGGALLWKRLWYRLLGLVLVVPGGMLLNIVLKNLFDRARPGWADPLMALTGPGFPSGHTMMATLIYGYIAIYLMLAIASWRWRAFMAIVTFALVFLVALSRMYLGAHYLSDVLAAMAAGTAWLAFCLTAVETLRRHRGLKLSGGAR